MKVYNIEEQVNKIKKLSTYNVADITDIDELSAKAVILEHKKTKARIFALLTDDNNKVFTFGALRFKDIPGKRSSCRA